MRYGLKEKARTRRDFFRVGIGSKFFGGLNQKSGSISLSLLTAAKRIMEKYLL